jgi:2-phosphoglycerate kinase
MENPTVVLIGGPGGAGKTTLGRALARRLEYSSATGDDLARVGRLLSRPEDHPALHQGPQGHLAYFTNTSPEDLIDDAVELQNTMWPVFERIIRLHARNEFTVVYDWWLFSPRLVDSLGEDRVGSAWIHIDPDVLREREKMLSRGFIDGSDDPERMLANFMERSLWRNDMVATEARELGLPVLHQDGSKSPDDLVDELMEFWSD